ncbi:DUF177 domain-containing protein [Myxococcota bacterium]|jgi:uncharacterized protein|nr:DUF177 domain-containing protein [Myxococcota bacterium]
MLRYVVEEIPESGLEVRQHLDQAWISPLMGPQFSPVTEGFDLAADLTRADRLVMVRGRISGRATFQCSRCLGDSPWNVAVAFTHLFVEDEVHARRFPGEVPEGDEMESSPYRDGVVDLEPLVAEELVLSLPQAPLCSEACRGLCQRCGKNLNEGPCGCPAEEEDPRWAPLKRIH